jgi:hypothetical protein
MTKTIMLTEDTAVEGIEYFDFVLTLTTNAATMAAASIATADTAEVFILDLSCEYQNNEYSIVEGFKIFLIIIKSIDRINCFYKNVCYRFLSIQFPVTVY